MMDGGQIEPLVDIDNPLYCPHLPADQFLANVGIHGLGDSDEVSFTPFSNRLRLSVDGVDRHYSHHHSKRNGTNSSYSPEPSSDVDTDIGRGFFQNIRGTPFAIVRRLGDHDSSSDDDSPLLPNYTKRMKRSSSEAMKSFVLSAKAERIRYPSLAYDSPYDADAKKIKTEIEDSDVFWPDGEPEGRQIMLSYEQLDRKAKALEEQLYGSDLGLETPADIAQLIQRLERLIPGVRLEAYMKSFSRYSHQTIADFLGNRGHFNARVLQLFRRANVQELRLNESVCDADGLNLERRDVLTVLRLPNSFCHVLTLILNDTPLEDCDFLLFNSLPRLRDLRADNTHIGNEAVMHLVALKSTLAYLQISWNPRINDDAIPCFCAFSKLEKLSVKGSAISILGLRRLAVSASSEQRLIALGAPAACSDYLLNLHNEYELDLNPPLVDDPLACEHLSANRLRCNLLAHSARNPDIRASGTREEMEARLRELLKRRSEDLLVLEFAVAAHEG